MKEFHVPQVNALLIRVLEKLKASGSLKTNFAIKVLCGRLWNKFQKDWWERAGKIKSHNLWNLCSSKLISPIIISFRISRTMKNYIWW